MKRLTCLLALLLMTVTAFSQDRRPDSYYETMITEFLGAVNSADLAQRDAALRAYYILAGTDTDRERWMGHMDRYHGGFGHFDIQSVRVDYPAAVHAICRVDGIRSISEWVDLGLNLDKDDPTKFRSMSLAPARDPSIVLPDRPLTTDEIAKYVKEFVERMAERDVFSGTVLLAKDGKPFFNGTYGYADLRWKVPNKLDTKFNLGSMNKMFTGTAICQLANEGKLSFDDHIIDHLSDYANPDVARDVTIRQLLTHTSGMASYWDAMSKMDWTTLRSVKDFADLTVHDSLLFEPGEQFHYSNSGPLVLGLIIEKITGMDYHDYIRTHVTGPAGMINTDCYNNDVPIPNLASGYFWNEDADTIRTWNIFAHSARGSAAGGGYSTVEDLNRFANALFDGKLLPMDLVDTLTTAKTMQGPDEGYAFLFGEDHMNGQRVVGHGGGAPGINADLKIFPDLGFTAAAMANYDEGASAVTHFAAELMVHGRGTAPTGEWNPGQ